MRAVFDTIYTFFQRPQPHQGMKDWVLAKPFAPPAADLRGFSAGVYARSMPLRHPMQGMPLAQSLTSVDFRGYGASSSDASGPPLSPLLPKPSYSDL